MTITFNGTAKAYMTFGNDALVQNLFTIENGPASRVNIMVRNMDIESDTLTVSTAVQSIMRTSRATSISGGIILEKVGFDTTQTSDPNVVFRTPLMDSARVTATPGTTIWQGYLGRMHTAVEQQQEPFTGRGLLPFKGISPDFRLRPGEALVVQLISAATASNAAVMNFMAVQCGFDEEAISTFAISGTVTLSGSPVTGAKVAIVEADDINLTNAFLREVITTPAGGAWSSTIRTGKIGYAYVQYNNGGTYYTAPGSPYLS